MDLLADALIKGKKKPPAHQEAKKPWPEKALRLDIGRAMLAPGKDQAARFHLMYGNCQLFRSDGLSPSFINMVTYRTERAATHKLDPTGSEKVRNANIEMRNKT